VLYLLFSTREYYWDGVIFALEIEKANGDPSLLFRPNHLLYNLTGYLLYTALDAQVRALFLLQLVNQLLAGLCVVLVYRILLKITESSYHSLCLSLFFAFSATWWRFATDADAYIPSIFFLLICFLLLLPSRKSRPIWLGVFHSMAMLFHQLAIFFLPVAVVALWRKRRKVSHLLYYGAVSGLLTASVYIFVYRSLSDAGSFWSWITTHSADSSFTFSLFHNAALSLRGNFRLFFGGRSSLLQFDAVTVIGMICLAVALGWCYMLRSEIKNCMRESWVQLNKQHLVEGIPLLIWIFSYVLFLIFWIPKNTFYRLFYLPAIIFLLGSLGRPWKERFKHSLVAGLIILAVWNFTFLIYPLSRAENNEILSFALRHRADWPQGTTIIYRHYHSDLWTISYFNPQAKWIGKDDFSDISAFPGDGPFWLEGTAYDAINENPEGEQWLETRVDSAGSLIYRSDKHAFRFFRVNP
jgi:hypothetical protein